MNRRFKAEINWIPVENGGRKIPPQGTRYCPLIRVCNTGGCEEWSIDFICPDFEQTNIIDFKFLVNDAPSGLLDVGDCCALYEGARRIAGIIIRECY